MTNPSDPSPKEPVYLQVQTKLMELIRRAGYGPGDRIPPERDLAEQLGVSRMTMRRATENLVQQGVLERRSTSGTYVREPRVTRPVGYGVTLGLTQLLRQEGNEPGSRLLSFETRTATQKVREALDLPIGAKVVISRRQRLVNGQPFCVEVSHLPASLVPGLAASDLIESPSLYSLLQERYGISIGRSDQLLSVASATDEEAELLGVAPGSPVLLLRSVVSDANGRNVEYLKSINHPDRVSFQAAGRLS